MKYIVVLFTAFLLSGCLGTTKPPGIVERQVQVDSKMLEACEPLNTTSVDSVEDVLRENISLYSKYSICARKQDDSIKLIKSFSGIKE